MIDSRKRMSEESPAKAIKKHKHSEDSIAGISVLPNSP